MYQIRRTSGDKECDDAGIPFHGSKSGFQLPGPSLPE
jgi:hypothetical protein